MPHEWTDDQHVYQIFEGGWKWRRVDSPRDAWVYGGSFYGERAMAREIHRLAALVLHQPVVPGVLRSIPVDALLAELDRRFARGVMVYEGHEMDAAEEGFNEALDAIKDFIEAYKEPPTTSPSTTSSAS